MEPTSQPLYEMSALHSSENSPAVPNTKPTAELPCKGTAIVGEKVLKDQVGGELRDLDFPTL